MDFICLWGEGKNTKLPKQYESVFVICRASDLWCLSSVTRATASKKNIFSRGSTEAEDLAVVTALLGGGWGALLG